MMFPSKTEAKILRVLGEGPAYGMEIVKNCGIRAGTVYVLLGRLEEKGLAQSRTSPPPPGRRGPNRRVYSLTNLGRQLVEIIESKNARDRRV